jgi:hypothetical protein
MYQDHDCTKEGECELLRKPLDEVGMWDISDSEDESLAEMLPKSQRFFFYSRAVRKLFGFLGRKVRIRHPKCLQGDIHDHAPKASNETYTGFQEA